MPTQQVSFQCYVVLLGYIHESAAVVQISLMEAAYSQKLPTSVTKFRVLDGFTMNCMYNLAPVAKPSASPSISRAFLPPYFRCSRHSTTNALHDQAGSTSGRLESNSFPDQSLVSFTFCAPCWNWMAEGWR